MSKIKTITVTATEQAVAFDATYQFVWFRSLGDGDVLVSDHSGIIEGADDVALVKGGESTRITVPYNKTVYIKAVSDSVDMEIHAQNFSDAPFEGGSGGSGGGGSVIIDPTPTQGSSNAVSSGGVYTALQNIPQPVDYSTTEQDTGRKWIDGKPIYQKTFTNAFSGLFIHQTWNNLSNVSISDIDSCIDVKVSCHDTYGGGSNIAFLNAYYFRINNGTVQLYSFEDWNILIDAITIWYTKTTDTAE